MSTIEKMREVGEMLINQKKYNEAYTIFDELYRQIWSIFGTVQGGYSGYSSSYFGPRIASGQMLRKQYPEPAANMLCSRMYGITLSSMLDEFIRIMQGHLRCISSSAQLRKENLPDQVKNEFAVLYTLADQPAQQRKLAPIFSITTAVVDRSNRIKRIVSNHPRHLIEKILVDHAQKRNGDALKSINSLLLDYLLNSGDRKSELFRKLSIAVGPSAYRFKYDQNFSDRYDRYARYSTYENFRRYSSSSSYKFYSSTATEQEKDAYYGRLIGLMGKVTREEIRSKYIGMISLYHPDRVQHLGPELKELAEIKSKEINAAYDWLKTRYRL
jgi:hypothetical protein